MDKVYCIIQARSNSTRLPRKIYLPFGESDILFHLVRQIEKSKLFDEVAVAIPFDEEHTLIERLADREINVFLGSETDVLDRFYQCAKLIQPDHIVRITADCPLITANIIDTVVKAHLKSGADYTANRLEEPMYPDGFDVEVFTMRALKIAWLHASIRYDKEHVTPYIKQHYKQRLHAVHCPPELLPWKDVKLSVDTQEDYERVVKWYEENKSWHK